MSDTTSKSWWQRFTETISSWWNKAKALFKKVLASIKKSATEAAERFSALFQPREMDENGRPVGETFLARVFSVFLAGFSFIGKVATIAVGFFLTGVFIVFLVKTLISVIIAALAVVLATVALLFAFKVLEGIYLAFQSAHDAYYDRNQVDEDWNNYAKMWKPKYWLCFSAKDFDVWDSFWEEFRATVAWSTVDLNDPKYNSFAKAAA